MRNYLPLIKLRRRANWVRRHAYLVASVVVVVTAGLISIKAVFAIDTPNQCGTNFMSNVPAIKDSPPFQFGSNGWDDASYHYQPVAFQVIADHTDADPGSWVTTEQCHFANYWNDVNGNGKFDTGEGSYINTTGSGEHINNLYSPGNISGAHSILWAGESPVGVTLGVVNQGAINNNGAYLSPTAVEKSPTKVRPPVFMRNFASAAGFVDDAGRATINPLDATTLNSIYGSSRPIWCNAIDTGGPPLTPVGEPNCGPDISDTNYFPVGPDQQGSGFLLSGADCHLNNPDNGFSAPGPGKDQDGYPAVGNLQCSPVTANTYKWYMNYQDVARHIYAGGAADTDLSDFIGCVGPCNGTNRLNSFIFNTSARQTLAGNFSAFTVLTFKYPRTATVNVTKTATGSFIPGTGATSVHYIVTIKKKATDPVIKDLIIADTMPQYLIPVAGCPGLGAPDNIPSPFDPNPRTVQWTFSPIRNTLLLAAINSGASVNLCVDARIDGAATPGNSFTNCAGEPAGVPSPPLNPPGLGSIGHTVGGRLVNIVPGCVTENFASPLMPYLTTAKGDVHAGGGLGFTVNCGSGGNLTGQAGASKGEYVVSANGSINGFGSAGSPASPGPLTAANYNGICRPDMDHLATTYTGKAQLVTYANNANLTANYGGNGALVTAAGDVTIPAGTTIINRRVTLWVKGDLIIKGNIAQSGGSGPAGSLGSFGVIVDGNIYIDPIVQNIAGYYFASGTKGPGFGKIITCANGKVAYTTNTQANANALGAACQKQLTVSGLLSAVTFDFNRIANPAGGGLVPSETINYLGLLFVAPPPVFDGVITPASGVTSESGAPPLY